MSPDVGNWDGCLVAIRDARPADCVLSILSRGLYRSEESKVESAQTEAQSSGLEAPDAEACVLFVKSQLYGSLPPAATKFDEYLYTMQPKPFA